MECIIKLISISKDIVLTIATGIGAYVAIKGLKTWRKQLKGQSDNELSRKILLAVYKYRDAVRYVRNPLMLPYEMPTPPLEETKRMSTTEIHFYGISEGYKTRFDRLQQLYNELNIDLLESKVLWGDHLEELLIKLFEFKFKLELVLQMYLNSKNPQLDSETRQDYYNQIKDYKDILYFQLPVEKDKFNNDLNDIITDIESYLKPKLI